MANYWVVGASWGGSDHQDQRFIKEEVFGYMGQFWKYLQIHREDLSGKKTIILNS